MAGEYQAAEQEAAVLTNKDKVWVGDEPIEDVEHFAHDGDEGDGFGFTGGDEASVEGAYCRHTVVRSESLMKFHAICARSRRPLMLFT